MPLRRSTVHALDVIAYTGGDCVDARPARQLRHVRAGDRGGARRPLPHAAADARSGRSRVADAVAPEAFEPRGCSPEADVLERVGGRHERRAASRGARAGAPRGRDRHVRRRPPRAPPRASRRRAAARLRPTVVTFDPHPRTAVRQPASSCSSTLERRLELLEEPGVDDVLVLRFDEALARARRRRRSRRRSCARSAREVVAAGDGFRFGHGRSGDLDLLERLGFDVRRVPLVDNVSSSHIRSLLAAGDVAHAATLLGRPPEVEGIVVTATSAARLLGFPTANLADAAGAARAGARHLRRRGARPPRGDLDRHESALRRHASGGSRRYLLDFDGDLYGRRLVVELWERLRDEAAFGSEAELVEAIDARRARGTRPPGRASRPATQRKFCRLDGVFIGMEAAHARRRAARRARERPLPRVRRDLLEAGRRRHRARRTPAARPAATSAGSRSACRRSRSAAPLRRGSAAAPARPSALTPPK